MKLDDLNKQEPMPLEDPNWRMLRTIAYLLKHHGYTYLADEINELASDIKA